MRPALDVPDGTALDVLSQEPMHVRALFIEGRVADPDDRLARALLALRAAVSDGSDGDVTHRLFIAGSGQDHASGWGFCLAVGEGVVAERGAAERGRNAYRMELLGLVEGLRVVPTGAHVEVVLANQTLLRTASEWLAQWRGAGWRKGGGPIQHLDLVQILAVELDRLNVRWVSADRKAHPTFIRARALARDAARGLPNAASVVAPPTAGIEPGPSTVRVESAAPAVRLIAYTDGGCRGNPGVGGWGFLLVDRRSGAALEKRGGERRTTNNRMELTAAIEALRALRSPGQQLEIRTDSEYLRQVAESWRSGWKRRGWRKADGAPVLNVDLVERLDGLLDEHTVHWKRVAAHAGEQGNAYADALANAAMDAVVAGGDGRAEVRHRVSPVTVAPAEA